MAFFGRPMNNQVVPQLYSSSSTITTPAQHSPITSSILTSTAPKNEQTACGLFRLPPELRNLIYEFACAPRYNSDTFEFLKAREDEPPVNILLTCRLVCREAIEVYHASRMAFWSTNAFVVPPGFQYDACGIGAKHIHHMTRIIINTDDGSLDHLDGLCEPKSISLTPAKENRLTWDVSEHTFTRVGRVLFRDTPPRHSQSLSTWFRFTRDRTLAISRGPYGNNPVVSDTGLKKAVLDKFLMMLRAFVRDKKSFEDFRRRNPHHFAGV